jgi:predicted phage baseplate assembly protein
MRLETPKLDDRGFQDILDEARRLIPRYCPEWTDHNLSDPGITLLELFAWMTDMLLYRVNRVPEKNYITFLELMGVRLEPARAATTELLFRLTAPQPEDIVIPRGTSVGTVRTEFRESITFATDADRMIRRPELVYVLADRNHHLFDYRRELEHAHEQALPGIFSPRPAVNDALYLGFGNDVGGHILGIRVECDEKHGVGVDPRDPPIVWETWDGLDERWVAVEKEADTTRGINSNGVVIVYLPTPTGRTAIDGKEAIWVRCRVEATQPGQRAYADTPIITSLAVDALGITASASHAFKVVGEELGESDGTPGQQFKLGTLPVLPRTEGETLEVEAADGTFEPWHEVADFGSSGPDDPHFVLDDVSGTVELGPRVRTPIGIELQYGRTPTATRRLRFRSYHSGGGVGGNVGAGTLTVLKSSIPYVRWVDNKQAAEGGRDSEDLEHAKWRAPQLLRARQRAVTPRDFEELAQEASAAVARARCLGVRGDATGDADGTIPGTVRLQLVPALPAPSGPLRPDDVEVPGWVRQRVKAYLDERRLLTTELELEIPTYTWVTVLARVRASPRASADRVVADAERVLYRFVHPTAGGPDGNGWPFGRDLFAGELYSLLQNVAGVDIVEEVTLQQVDPNTLVFSVPRTRLTPGGAGLLGSYRHQVIVT